MSVVDRLDCKNDLLASLSSHLPMKRDTTLATKVQLTRGFIAIKTVLWLHLAVNEKSQRRYGTHSKQQQALPEKYVLHKHMYLDTN